MANATVSRSTAAGAIRARSSRAAIAGPGRRSQAVEAEPGDRPVLADDGRHVGDGSDGREVGEVEGRGRSAGLVREEQLRDLEGDAAPRQASVRIRGVRPMRVDDGDRVGQDGRDAVMVGDDDVDPARARGGDLGDAGGAAVDRDDQRGAARRPRRRPPPATVRGPRRGGSARTASTVTPKRRSASVMIASPVSPSASKSPKTMTRSRRVARGPDPGEEDVRIGQAAPGHAGPPADRRTRRSGRRGSTTPRAAQQRRKPCRDAEIRRPRGDGVGRPGDGWEGPAEARFDHGSGCHAGLHHGSTGRVRLGPQDAVRRTRGLRVVGDPAVASVVPEVPVDQQRRGVEDRRVGPRDDPDQQRQHEVAGSPRRRTAAARAASGPRSGWS